MFRKLLATLCLICFAPSAVPADGDIVAALFVGAFTDPADPAAGMNQLNVALNSTDFGEFIYSGLVYDDADEQGAIDDILAQDVERLVLIGHSLGGQAVVNVARTLENSGVIVNLTVQLDSFGNDDDLLPANVRQGFNYYQTPIFPDVIGGETNVTAVDPNTKVENFKVETLYGVADDQISHTQIDDRQFGYDDPGYAALFGDQPDLHHRIAGHILAQVPEPSASIILGVILLAPLNRRVRS
jgi:pimeloyl-ACP methyl ester carboxylesterase